MYHTLIFSYNYFLNFVVHKINSEIVKSVIMILTRREKTDMTVDLCMLLMKHRWSREIKPI
jgi:hypothetical protein